MSVPAEVDQVVELARRAGLRPAAEWISKQRLARWPHRDWDLGRCIWCEIDTGALVEAVESDPGGGAPMCLVHAWCFWADPAEITALEGAADGAQVGGEAFDGLVASGLVRLSGTVTSRGRRALKVVREERTAAAS